MTIKQLYEWAFQNDAQNFDIGMVNQDSLEIDWISTKDLIILQKFQGKLTTTVICFLKCLINTTDIHVIF